MTEISSNIKAGVLYTALSKYSTIVTNIFISAVLARILTPAEFGVVAISTVFISFFNLLSNFGISPAIIQNKSLTEKDISSIFSFSILFGLFLSFLFFLAAPFIASFYNEPALNNICRLLSLSILFNSLQVVPSALMLKKLQFKVNGIISFSASIISGIVAIILAYLGFSYYALVINSLLTAIITFSTYYYMSPIHISFSLSFSSIKKISKFSIFQFMFNVINYFSRNLDNLLIGKFFSPSDLGYYDKSYRLMKMPLQNLTFVITPVLHPILTNYQNEKQIIFNTYFKIVKFLAIIGFPLSIFFFFTASEIVFIIYGPQWGQSIPVFKLLALSVGIQMVLSSTGSIFQATNRTELMFYSGFISTIFTVSGIIYGVFIGNSLISVGYGVIIAFGINFFQGLFLLIKIALGQSYLQFLKVFLFPITLSISIGIALWLLTFIEINNIFLSVVIKLILSLFVAGIVFVFSKENLEFTTKFIGKIFKK